MKTYETECKGCEIKFKWKKKHSKHQRKYCCKKCSVNHKNLIQFRWDDLSEKQKLVKLKENLEQRITKKEGCWEWNGAKDKNGYGQMQTATHNKLTKAHRISWMVNRGPIPNGLRVCHHCDNPPCTNPDHLFLGTAKDNSQDMSKKGRSTKNRCMEPKKKKPRKCKLNPTDVLEIKKCIFMGVKGSFLAKKYGVSSGNISDIKRNKSWKHITL